jgi:phage terminase Nu1 subunit (DNA packaging protein)
MTQVAMSKDLTVTALSKHYEVSRQTIYNWQKAGCPLDSIDAIDAWRKEHQQPTNVGSLSEQLYREKIRKTREEADRTALENRKSRGELLDAYVVNQWIAGHVIRLKERLQTVPIEFATELPGEMRGTGHEVASRFIDRLLNELASWASDTETKLQEGALTDDA